MGQGALTSVSQASRHSTSSFMTPPPAKVILIRPAGSLRISKASVNSSATASLRAELQALMLDALDARRNARPNAHGGRARALSAFAPFAASSNVFPHEAVEHEGKAAFAGLIGHVADLRDRILQVGCDDAQVDRIDGAKS